MAVAVNEKLITGAIAIMAVVGAFVVVQAIRSPRTPASPPASRHVHTAETIVSDYKSTRGFAPFVYRNDGATGWFTMLDIIPEDGPLVRWVDVSMVNNSQGGIGFAFYNEHRTNCRTWQAQLLRIGFPADKIEPAPNTTWFSPEAGTQIIAGSYVACKHAGKLT